MKLHNHAKREYYDRYLMKISLKNEYIGKNCGWKGEITDGEKWFISVHTLIMDRFYNYINGAWFYLHHKCIPVPERMFSNVVSQNVLRFNHVTVYDTVSKCKF